jgi:hypothetical protein
MHLYKPGFAQKVVCMLFNALNIRSRGKVLALQVQLQISVVGGYFRIT